MKFTDLWRVKQNSEAKYPKHHSFPENIKSKFKISSLANQESQRHNEEQTASLFSAWSQTWSWPDQLNTHILVFPSMWVRKHKKKQSTVYRDFVYKITFPFYRAQCWALSHSFHTHFSSSKYPKTSSSQVNDAHIPVAQMFAVIAVLQLYGRLKVALQRLASQSRGNRGGLGSLNENSHGYNCHKWTRPAQNLRII